MTREYLTAPRIYYVDSVHGNDANDGLSSATAFASLSFVASVINNTLDLGGQSVGVMVADGAYTSGFQINGGIPGNGDYESIWIQGNLTNPQNVTINPGGSNRCFYAFGGGKFTVKGGFDCGGSDSSASGILPIRAELPGSYIRVEGGPMRFGKCACAFSSEWGAVVFAVGINYTTYGNQYYHLSCIDFGCTIVRDCVETLVNTPVWGACYANFDRHSYLGHFNMSFSGAAVGRKFVGGGNSTCWTYTGAGNVNYYPGTTNSYTLGSSAVYY